MTATPSQTTAPTSTATPRATATATLTATAIAATATPEPTATPTLPVEKVADLAITLDDGVATIGRGHALPYVITVTNNGPGAVIGALVRNRFPRLVGRIVRWTCTASPGSTCTASSTDALIRDRVAVAPNGVLVYAVDAYVRRFALGTIRNVADVRPPEGVTDPNDANNLAVDTTSIIRR